MAVRNQHVRQSKRYVYKTIDGARIQFSPAPFVDMAKVRYAATKAVNGKLGLDTTLRGVEVQEDGSIRQFEL